METDIVKQYTNKRPWPEDVIAPVYLHIGLRYRKQCIPAEGPSYAVRERVLTRRRPATTPRCIEASVQKTL